MWNRQELVDSAKILPAFDPAEYARVAALLPRCCRKRIYRGQLVILWASGKLTQIRGLGQSGQLTLQARAPKPQSGFGVHVPWLVKCHCSLHLLETVSI